MYLFWKVAIAKFLLKFKLFHEKVEGFRISLSINERPYADSVDSFQNQSFS